MIWFTLALFVVSFLVTALLAPKPEIENARASELDPNNFPRATEDAPIPLVLGCARVNGPNTMWYGDFRAKKIKEKVKTGLFSSTKVTVGHKYYLGLDMGICLGPNVILKEIYWDEEEILDGGPLGETPLYDYTQGAEDLFPIGLNLGVPYTNFTIAEYGVTPAMVDSGQVQLKCQFTGTYVNALGDPGNLTIKLWVTPLDGSGGALTIEPLPADQVSGLGEAVVDFTFLVPVGTRSFDVRGTFAIFGVGGTASATVQNIELLAPLSGVAEGTINKKELFGGHKNGGGLSGTFRFYPGNFNQPVDDYVEAEVGAGNVPAYRGTSHIVFEDFYIGESASLRPIAFLVACYPATVSGGFYKVGDDINPMEALYHVLTDPWRGLGLPTSMIDEDEFLAAAETLFNENVGISIVISSPQEASKIVSEILRVVDGILYQDPTTGKIRPKLIRNDYTVGSLPSYGEADVLKVLSFSKTTWEDVFSEVKLSFSTRDKESSSEGLVAVAQDAAVANMIGRRKSTPVSYPFVYDPDLANTIAWRELAQLSVPLISVSLEMNRSGYSIKPGDVFRWSWPEYGISNVVLRALKYDLGALLDNRVVLECVQDKFGVGSVVFAPPADSAWTNPVAAPTPIVDMLVVEMPYFFASRLENPPVDGYASVIPLPLIPSAANSTGFSMVAGTATDVLEVDEPTDVEYPVVGLLSADLSFADGFATGLLASGITITNTIGTPLAALLADVRSGDAGILYVAGEWMAYEGVTDNGGGSYTLSNVRRGILGSRPRSHLTGTKVRVLTPALLGTGVLGDELLDSGTLYYKLLDIAGDIVQDPESVVEQTLAMQGVADRPLRPRNLQLDASRTLPFQAAGSHDLTWIASNRAASQITFEQDAAETPDAAEQYDLEVWVDGVQNMSLSQTNVTSPHAVDFTGVSGTSAEIRLYAKRTGGGMETSFDYGIFPVGLSVTVDSDTITVDQTDIQVDQS